MTATTPVTLRVFGLLALGAVLAGCHHAPTARHPTAIDWRTSPLDLNLRGMNGKNYLFRCPAGKPIPESVTGSGPYTDASSICAAAAHSGVLDTQRGGTVMIRILPERNSYSGTVRNFIQSMDYRHPWGGSFAVLSRASRCGERMPSPRGGAISDTPAGNPSARRRR